jgi:glycosyltransferase involved in cell wall biosynthesis
MTTSQSSVAPPLLSVAMIVRNEQDVLAESLESVRPVADEIVILDTGSTDQTLSIAKRFGATVSAGRWNNDFAAARNACLRAVRGKWVLWLDAGERLAADSLRQLRDFVERQADPNKAYLILVEVPSAEPGSSGEQAAQPRLMPNRRDLRFDGRVRETLRPAIEAAGMIVESAPGRIVRHPRQHSQARRIAKANRDLELAAQEAADRGLTPPCLLLTMGEAYSTLGLQDRARGVFRKAIDTAVKGSSEMLEAYYGLLTALEGEQYLRDIQLSVCLEALEIFPFDAQLLLAMGNYLQSRQRLDLAGRAFDTAVKYGQVDLAIWHLSELAETAAACLSVTLQIQGHHDRALQVLEEGLERCGDSPRLLRHRMELHVKHARCDEALTAVARLPLDAEQKGLLATAVRGACKAVESDWIAALGYLQSAYVGGCRDTFVLRWLAVTLLSNGQVDAAQPVLAEWAAREPNNTEVRMYISALTPSAAEKTADSREADRATHTIRIDQHGAAPPIASHAPAIQPAPSADAMS